MDLSDRPHRTTSTSSGTTSELFICFTSGLSSSSMKLSSKCILSPGRNREPAQTSLTNSLSRRLKSNVSIKGGQASPMFPTGGKKRGCGFENPEPSSPKVTCIGQVRVKTKKQGKRFRTRSKRRGETSFRKIDQNVQVAANPDLSQQHNQGLQYQNSQQDCLSHRNQRWVHISLTICEALKAFGSEFNCFLPCRSTCMSSEGQKDEKAAPEKSGSDDRRDSSCGAVSRWLVSLQEDEMKGREIELVIGKDERVERSSQRRHIFDEVDFSDDMDNGQGMEVEEEKPRVSVCIPPKNALLLMRCRSDPVKMAALANKFWESPVRNDDKDQEENYLGEEQQLEEAIEQEHVKIESETKGEDFFLFGKRGTLQTSYVQEEHEIPKAKPEAETAELEYHRVQEQLKLSASPETYEGKREEVEIEEEKEEADGVQVEEEIKIIEEVLVDAELLQVEESQVKLQQGEKEELDQEGAQFYALQRSEENAPPDLMMSVELQHVDCEPEAKFEVLAETTEESMEEKEQQQEQTTDRNSEDKAAETVTLDRSLSDSWEPNQLKWRLESSERERPRKAEKTVLPDCLLLMMCEPKLSMEVSKETWVCRADFIRWLPERSDNKIDGGDAPKKRISIDSKPSPQQQVPPKEKQRQVLQLPISSCSYPEAAAPLSMANVIEKKLVGSNAYEPFVLTRCKSEPMRPAAKLAPEPCFWKNRKVEPHRPITFGIGAARVGC